MFPGVDTTKAQTFFHYCGHATKKMVERDYVRIQLEDQITKLKRMANKDVKGQLDALERQIAMSIQMEQRIARHQGEEDVFHRKLRDKIELLEKRLGVFLETRESRTNRIRELEDKIVSRLSSKSQKMALIKEDIAKLQAMHKELEKSGKYKKKLEMIDEKIDELKGRLKVLES